MFDSLCVKHHSPCFRSRPTPLILLKELRNPVGFPRYWVDGTDLSLSELRFRMETL
jgi:hypothetical protein